MTAPVRGIALMLAALVVFALADTASKFTLASINPMTGALINNGAALLASSLLLARTPKPHRLVSARLPLHILRGVLLAAIVLLVFKALPHLQLAQLSAIGFTSPIWVCALSGPVLGETVGPRRWAAVAFGLLGVLVVMRPGGDGFHWAMPLALGAAFSAAAYNIVTRKIGGADKPETSLVLAFLMSVAIIAFPAMAAWEPPALQPALSFAAIGAGATAAHYLIIRAHQLAPASTLAPYIYLQILCTIALGFAVFGDVPDRWTLFGAAIVAASGFYLFRSERAQSA